jgi:hypothetical protein
MLIDPPAVFPHFQKDNLSDFFEANFCGLFEGKCIDPLRIFSEQTSNALISVFNADTYRLSSSTIAGMNLKEQK